jgi:predicted phage baseplate assembly protein
MRLPEITLDDRHFQSLVDEARLRIADTCPEWTEHNVSDPGITLIELFAWMTDLLLHRVNQLPVRLQLALLELLDITPQPPEPAGAGLRFLLAGPQQHPVLIPASTEVASDDAPGRPAIVYTTAREVVLPTLTLRSVVLERTGAFTSIRVVDGVARPVGADREVFSTRPTGGDCLYLGFRQPIANLVLDIAVKTVQARGVAIAPALAPLDWEVSTRDGTWAPATVVKDTTGGLNFTEGAVRLQVPARESVFAVAGEAMHWVRCRVRPSSPEPGHDYLDPPKIMELSATACGAIVPAEHAHVATDELLGYSDGTPGQRFALHQTPALALDRDDEGLEVRDPVSGEFVAWTLRDSLAASGALDRHYRFDAVTGEVEFGPAVRETTGWRQCGAIPPAGVAIRMKAYRYGGGTDGNLEANTLTHLRTGVPGIGAVTNPAPTTGGVGRQSMAELRSDAAQLFRTRRRAVTTGDFETLVDALPRVHRSRCLGSTTGDPARVYVLPTIADGQTAGPTPANATASPALVEEVRRMLEGCMVLGTSVHVTPAPLRIAVVAVEVTVAGEQSVKPVQEAITRALSRFVNPYIGDQSGGGWTWGRSLHAGELTPLVRAIPRVTGVGFVRLYEVDAATGRPTHGRVKDRLSIAPEELLISGTHLVRAVVG